MTEHSHLKIELPGAEISFYGDGATYIVDSYTSERFKNGRRARVTFGDAERPGEDGETGSVRWGHGNKFVDLTTWNHPGIEADRAKLCKRAAAALRQAIALDSNIVLRGRVARYEDMADRERRRIETLEIDLAARRKKLTDLETTISMTEIDIKQGGG